MNTIAKLTSTAFLGAALIVSTPASAQGRDLNPEQVAAAARYSLPHAFEGYLTRCSATLDVGDYAISNAPRLRTKFANGAGAAWPGARALMMQLAQEEASDMSAVFAVLSDSELRPFIDGMIAALVEQKIELETCQDIERGLEILDPLPADNVAAFVGFMADLVKNESESRTVTGRVNGQ